ncbi:MMPL family transporter [Nesterenkonia marinintestina]|uniref:MMPL family transporter n=1 Tax=Nesterenkonia marinintestina TaxID=2979865 RepID=UPI0021C1E2DD|nr:MMPL family transporter [Nesterenkonia sp. GX14115]
MSRWLARLGALCARRAKTVVALWLVLLIGAVSAAALFSEEPDAGYEIPEAEYEQVMDRLGEGIEEFDGAGALVVLTSEDDESFTSEQREGVSALTDELETLDEVRSAEDPFVQQEDIDSAEEEISEAREELENSAAELEDGQEQLDAGREELEEAQDDLDAQQQEVDQLAEQIGDDAPQVVSAQEEIDAGQDQLDEQREELDEQQEELDDGWAEHADGVEETDLAERETELGDGARTVSEDGTAAMMNVQLVDDAFTIDADQQQRVIDAVEDGLPDGVDADFSLELVQDVSGILGTSEALGIAFAGLVLLITLGTVVAAGLPVLLAMLGVGISVALIFALSAVVDLTETDPVLALMLGLSLGIDYTLLLLYRHRQNLLQGMDVPDSIRLAAGTAGSAIFFAGVTNVIALGALAVTGIPFLTVMGLAASLAVTVVVAAVLTLGPALAALLGLRLLPRRRRPGSLMAEDVGSPLPTPEQNRLTAAERSRLSESAQERIMDRGWGRVVTRHPWAAILVPLVLVGALAVPAADLRLGLPDGGSEPEGTTAQVAYDEVRESFGAGENGPLLALITLPEGLDDVEQRERALDVAEDLDARESVARAVPAASDEAGEMRLIQIVPEHGPEAIATADLVDRLLDERGALADEHGLESVGLTGQTVANIEVADRLQGSIPLYVGIVVLLCLVILMAVFRSLVAPALAAAGYVFSLLGTLGAVVMVFQWGWLQDFFGVTEPGPVLAFLPILICGVLFGLAVDYQLFIMSGVREAYSRGRSARTSILSGIAQGGPVVVACGIIMISVFAGFVFADLAMIRPVGFGLAVGVLIEAFLVRATLIPAVTGLLGDRAWYLPRWLDRIIPDVDVEGRALDDAADTESDGPEGARRIRERVPETSA